MKNLYKRLLFAVCLIGILIVIRYSRIGSYINLEYVRVHQEYLQLLVSRYYGLSLLCFVAIYIIVILCALPFTMVLNIAGGYFFGGIFGALYSIIGATLGAVLSFFMFRYLLKNFVQGKYGDNLRLFNQEFKKRGASYLLFLQLLPITPFSFITLISGLSPISWLTFMWTTALGIAPGAFIYAFAGQQLMTIKKTSDILSWPLLVLLLALAGLSLVPIGARYVSAWLYKK